MKILKKLTASASLFKVRNSWNSKAKTKAKYYLIIVQHLINVHDRKLRFIWLAKRKGQFDVVKLLVSI